MKNQSIGGWTPTLSVILGIAVVRLGETHARQLKEAIESTGQLVIDVSTETAKASLTQLSNGSMLLRMGGN